MTVDEINSALCTVRCLPRGLLPSLQTSLITTWGNNLTPTPPLNCTLFDTGLIQAGAGVQTWAHGFSRTPPIVLPVTACVADDANLGYVAGDEIPLYMWRTNEEIGDPWGISLVLANSTQLVTQTCSFAVGNEASLFCWIKGGNRTRANPSSIDNWRLRVRCFDCDEVVALGPWDQMIIPTILNHGLGSAPSVCLCTIRCKQADAVNNFAVGDEVPAWMFGLEQFQGYHWVNSTVDSIIGFTNLQPQTWVKGTNYATALLPDLSKYEKWVYNLL